jgi:putative transport protein
MILQTLSASPELGVFLAVGLGYSFGRLKLGSFNLGTVTAALIFGLIIGNFWKEPSGDLRSGFFLLFLFANGYSVGPQFMSALKSSGAKPLVLSLVVCATGLIATVVLAKAFDLNAGIGAGLFSGALTASAAIGTATDAIKGLSLPAETTSQLVSYVAVADAVCYIFGAIGVIWFVGSFGPRLLGIDLREETKALEKRLGIEEKQAAGVFSAKLPFTARSFRLDARGNAIGKRIKQIESLEPGATVFVARVRRDGSIVEPTPDMMLQPGDAVVLYGHVRAVLAAGMEYGEETADEELLDFPVEVLRVVVTNQDFCNRSGAELRRLPETRFVVIRSVRRGNQPLPLGTMTMLEPGDVVELLGPQVAVDRLATLVGYALRPTVSSSLFIIAFGIFLGGVIGAPYLLIGSFKLTLGGTVGVLLFGVALGLLSSMRPTLPRLPDAAVELMRDMGLAVFVASVGMMAGPVFIHSVRELGPVIFLAGVVVTLVPQFAALLVGHYVLRMNPILLLGALAGAQTYTGALAALQEKSGSSVAVLGYTVPYAVSNILLTALGSVVVALLA